LREDADDPAACVADADPFAERVAPAKKLLGDDAS
jgi:hypothetical protein